MNTDQCYFCTQKKQNVIYDLRSLNVVIIVFFFNLFMTNVTDTVKLCQDQFECELPSVLAVVKAGRVHLFRVALCDPM